MGPIGLADRLRERGLHGVYRVVDKGHPRVRPKALHATVKGEHNGWLAEWNEARAGNSCMPLGVVMA